MYFISNLLLEIKKAKLISSSFCLHKDAILDSDVLFLSERAVHQFVLLRGLKQEKPQFKMYMDSDEKHCSDWVWGKFIFIIRLNSLKLSTHKDDEFLPAWRNCCIIVTYESFEALMHGHVFVLCLINFCISFGTPNTVNYRESLTWASNLRAGHLSTKI